MRIHEVMSSPAHTCRPQDSLESAARMLWEHDCGMLPVVDRHGKVTAAITDRDICMGALTRGQRLADLRVADSMSRRVVTCTMDEDAAVAAQRMAEHQLHRMPVLDTQGMLRGVVSLNDLALAGEHDTGVGRAAARVLVAACRHRTLVPAIVPTASPSPRPAAAQAART
jgi:CBS-domain-containing membrane protein